MVGAALLLGACDTAPGGRVYITSGRTDEVIRLDAADGAIVRRVPLDRMRLETDEPHDVAVSADGRHWYATVAHGEPSFWKFETAGDRLVGRVDLPSGGAAQIGLSADGTTAYVPDYDRGGGRVGHVAAIRLRDLRVMADARVCEAPHEAAAHPTEPLVAVACSGSDEVVLLDAGDLSVVRRIGTPTAEARPFSVVWSEDGALLAVALHSAGAVWLVDREGETRGLVPVGAGPAQLAVVDAGTMVSANRMSGTISVIDVDDMREMRRVELGAPMPHGVAVDPRSRTAFVAYEGTIQQRGGVIALDVDSGAILWRSEVGRYVLGIAYLGR